MIIYRKLEKEDTDQLLDYLHSLSKETQQKFMPHRFNIQAINELFEQPENYQAFIALDAEAKKIIAYSLIKIGYFEHDLSRYQSYGIEMREHTDCMLAPSVADEWQGKGVGTKLFTHIINELKNTGIKRIFLWGGVQVSNQQAIHFYQKRGFKVLGEFEHHGHNLDMHFELRVES